MKKEISIIASVLILVLGGAYILNKPKNPGLYKEFAQCLKDKGAVFYGAFWCPHCKSQKEDFGDAVSSLPYVECSSPDGKNQNAVCTAKDIKTYPTWIFADNTREAGRVEMSKLSEKTGCVLPQNTEKKIINNVKNSSEAKI